MTEVIGLIEATYSMRPTGGTIVIRVTFATFDGQVVGSDTFEISYLVPGSNLRNDVFNGAHVVVAALGFDLVKLIFPDFVIVHK